MERLPQLYDICVVSALPEEARSFIDVLERHCNVTFEEHTSPRYQYHYRSAAIKNDKDERLNLHLSWLSRYGSQEMTLHLSHVLEEYQPRIAIMTGICAGDAQQVQLGDLVVAERTFTYDSGKFLLDDEGRTVHRHDTTTNQLDANILQFLALFEGWQPLVTHLKRPPLLPESKLKRRGIRRHLKPMASGNAVRADHPFEEVRIPVLGTVAIDMESAAFGLVMSRHPHIPWLVVKGVCDYADQDKNDTYHNYAARASALYAFSFIRAYVTNDLLPQSSETKPSIVSNNLLPQSNEAKLSIIWNVPPLNNYFTGRVTLLQHLYETLNADNIVTLADTHVSYFPIRHTPQAISGMGGIGKTQTAIEYARRYSDTYEAMFWVKADNVENIRSDFISIAARLNLPEKDPQRIVTAVKDWLEEHTKWLIIFDNADNLKVVQDFLPYTSDKDHHTLITTRAFAVGQIRATRVEVNTMEKDEGVLFLFRRANILHPTHEDQSYAEEIVKAMGGLPLALEQAGAYIEETGTSISGYLECYQKRQMYLLNRPVSPFDEKSSFDYPYTVATVWSLSFDKVQRANPAAIELLRLCAFLDPDAIPEEIITGGTSILGPVLGSVSSDSTKISMNEIIRELLRFSLIRRNSEALTIHRLVQFVIQNDMDKETQRMWAERAILTIHHAFPANIDDVKTWSQCDRCLPHALACKTLIDTYELASPEAVQLLNQVGYYLREKARFEEAEPFFRQALAVSENLGPEHLLYTARILNNWARLYFDQYKYAEAGPLYERAQAIREQKLNSDDPVVAQGLNSLGLNCWYEGNNGKKGKYEEAGLLFQRALNISEHKLGPEHSRTLHILNNQALLYMSQHKYNEAIKLNQHVLEIREKNLGPVHLDVAQSLQNLAVDYYEKGEESRFEEAEDLLKRALTIREELLPESHPQIARCLHYLASLYQVQGKNEDAEKCFKRALDIREKVLRADNPQTVETKKKYDAVLQKMKQNKEPPSSQNESK